MVDPSRDEFDNLRGAVRFALDHDDDELAVRLVGRLWRLNALWRVELLDWARDVLRLPGSADQPDVGYVHVIVASMAWVTGERDESERSSEEALRAPLDEDAFTLASLISYNMIGYRGEIEACAVPYWDAQARIRRLRNRIWLDAIGLGSEAYGGDIYDIDVDQLIADADATGIPDTRGITRAMVALSMVARRRSAEAPGLIRDALQILQPGLNRRTVNICYEVLSLVDGTGPGTDPADDVAHLAARALELGREYPLGMGFALVGLLAAAHHQALADDAAMLAGYISSHLYDLALPGTTVEAMTGAPIEQFVAPSHQAQFEAGREMSAPDLNNELERIASRVGHVPQA